MTEAVRMCLTNEMSVRAAAKMYSIPRATLQSWVNGTVEIDASADRKSLLPDHLE